VIRAVAGLSTQVTRMESDVRVLMSDRHRDRPLSPEPERDPWLRH
jgi:hypothetical protein